MSDNIDWNTVLKEQESEPGFSAVPETSYDMIIDKAEATRASTGAPMIKVQAKIEGGPYDGRIVFTNIVFSDNATAMKFTLRKLNGLGVSKETLAAHNPSVPQIATMIEGVRFIGEVVKRPYEGEDRNDIKSFKAPAGGTAAPLPPKPAGVPSLPADDAVPGRPDVPSEEPF